jgi:hypothetical protein
MEAHAKPKHEGNGDMPQQHAYSWAVWFVLSSILIAPRERAIAADSRADQQEKEIATLIAQLGSTAFQERERATQALFVLGRPALIYLRHAAAENKDLEIRHRARLLVQRLENTLDELLVMYRSLDLPVPPQDAPLIRFQRCSGYVKGRELPPSNHLGFLVQQRTRTTGAKVSWNARTVDVEENRAIQVVEPHTRRGVDDICGKLSPLQDDDLILIVQCKARGYNRLADALFHQLFPAEKFLAPPKHLLPASDAPRSLLARLAWDYWQDQLGESHTDWAKIAPRLRAMMTVYPQLDDEANRQLMESLAAALVPNKAKLGTIPAMIDDLIQCGGSSLIYQEAADPRYLRLLDQGFAAVPHLIEHLDDARLTRQRSVLHAPPFQLVQHVVSDLLEELAGEPLQSGRTRPRALTKADARAWWENARVIGEEKYLLAHVLKDREALGPNDHQLYLIAKKYPQHLPAIYRKMLDERPQMRFGWWLVSELAKSSLEVSAKREAFRYALRNGSAERRCDALGSLRLDVPDLFRELVIEMLDALPKTPSKPYSQSEANELAAQVRQSDDPKVWDALTKFAVRADIGQRMEVIDRMGGEGKPAQVLKFLGLFLNDTSVRDARSNPMLFQLPYAGQEFPRIEVRNFSALRLAALLNLSETPKPDWNAEQWASLRAKVRAGWRP